MAGMIIVRGDLDQVEEVRAAKEQVMVLQAIEVGDDFQLLDPIPDPTKTQAFFPRTYTLYTINGRLNPRIVMRPGEVQRWRMLNAAEGKYLSLRLDAHDFNVLAWDGLTLAAPDRVGVVMLSAGNRVDVLVKAGAPGRYSLILTPGSSQKPRIPGMPDEPIPAINGSLLGTASPVAAPDAMSDLEEQGLPEIPGELEVRPILTVEVTGESMDMALPATLPAWDPPMLPITRKRALTYTVQRHPDTEFVSFGINGLPFDPDRPPYQIKRGTAEEWTLTNGVDMKLMDHAHVFHIHTNPFRITKINGNTLATPLWRDTFVLTRTTGDSLTFEASFVDFVGKFVEHCHVVSHEDLGMMESIEVIP
jgi:FtsP/CotA-like multicopper oxidase with cupredoxin domain